MPPRGIQVDAKVVAQVPDGGDAAAPDVGNGGGSGTGEQPAGVVATEQHGREVEHVAVAQPSTTRSGSLPTTWRTVSSGSSDWTVPAPTRIASLSARSWWASARAATPVIQRLDPSGAALRPSRLVASFRTTYGRPVDRCV